jgi:hypothetical protein
LPAQRAEWHAAWGAFRVAAIYAVLAAMWLLAYGRGPVIPLQGPLGAVNRLHLFQGWLYVVLTATLLYALLREYGAAQERERVAQRLLLAGGAAAIVRGERIVCASPSLAAWLTGGDLAASLHPADRAELARILRARPGVPIEARWRLATPGGGWRPLAVMVCSATWEGRPATLCLFSPADQLASPVPGRS